MPSDEKRLAEVLRHIRIIKAGTYPAIVGRDGNYRILDRPWADLAEPAKLAVLMDAPNWEGVTNRDMAHILLSEIDPGKITDAQRNRLIDLATVPPDYQNLLAQKAGAAAVRRPEKEPER